jgi:hypothetical protein
MNSEIRIPKSASLLIRAIPVIRGPNFLTTDDTDNTDGDISFCVLCGFIPAAFPSSLDEASTKAAAAPRSAAARTITDAEVELVVTAVRRLT